MTVLQKLLENLVKIYVPLFPNRPKILIQEVWVGPGGRCFSYLEGSSESLLAFVC